MCVIIATTDAESLTVHKEDAEDVMKLDDPLFVKFKASDRLSFASTPSVIQ